MNNLTYTPWHFTEVVIKQAKPKDKAYKIADSGGIIARSLAVLKQPNLCMSISQLHSTKIGAEISY